ncbi:MAG: D-lyxose/D-mannose family sugar isomerase [Bacteroidales bacterium]|jgi:D-lyxose ketol-isomerase|nr:D-lyxose/D-mannose family sugar isomerase [Bacteroidales bacterium]
MKRSDVNQYIDYAMKFMAENKFCLPPWAYWTPSDWEQMRDRCEEIFENGLGWDITDFGSGNFIKTGLTLVTLRNGNLVKPSKQYCEKIMLVRNSQVTPLHYHVLKTEDIINRTGGLLCMKLWNSAPDGSLSEGLLEVKIDSITTTIRSGEKICLKPGQSICYTPYLYHTFWAEGGDCLVGEVSSVNDDKTDNRFQEERGRYSAIDEDAPILHYLCNEYPRK